jgi:hypothetical protein
MDKWRQKFSSYFFVALILLFLLQNYLRRRPNRSTTAV